MAGASASGFEYGVSLLPEAHIKKLVPLGGTHMGAAWEFLWLSGILCWHTHHSTRIFSGTSYWGCGVEGVLDKVVIRTSNPFCGSYFAFGLLLGLALSRMLSARSLAQACQGLVLEGVRPGRH